MKDRLVIGYRYIKLQLCKLNAHLDGLVRPIDTLKEDVQSAESELTEELLACDDAFTNRFKDSSENI